MELKDLVLKIFRERIGPTTIDGIAHIKRLDEIKDIVTLFFVDRKTQTVSLLQVDKAFPIDKEKCGVVNGYWELGGYNENTKDFYSMGKYSIPRDFLPKQTFVTQESLDSEEVYKRNLEKPSSTMQVHGAITVS